MSHADAIMRVLTDGLIGISGAACHRPQVAAMPDFRPCRWRVGRGGMEGQVGPLEDAGMRASSPYTTQSGSARSRMGSHLRLPVQLRPCSLPAAAPSAGYAFPRAAARVRR